MRFKVSWRTISALVIGGLVFLSAPDVSVAKSGQFRSPSIGAFPPVFEISFAGIELAQADHLVHPSNRTANNDLVPLSRVLAKIRARYPGKHLDVNVIRGPSPRYIVIWLTPDGRRLDIVVDARSGQIISGG